MPQTIPTPTNHHFGNRHADICRNQRMGPVAINGERQSPCRVVSSATTVPFLTLTDPTSATAGRPREKSSLKPNLMLPGLAILDSFPAARLLGRCSTARCRCSNDRTDRISACRMERRPQKQPPILPNNLARRVRLAHLTAALIRGIPRWSCDPRQMHAQDA